MEKKNNIEKEVLKFLLWLILHNHNTNTITTTTNTFHCYYYGFSNIFIIIIATDVVIDQKYLRWGLYYISLISISLFFLMVQCGTWISFQYAISCFYIYIYIYIHTHIYIFFFFFMYTLSSTTNGSLQWLHLKNSLSVSTICDGFGVVMFWLHVAELCCCIYYFM